MDKPRPKPEPVEGAYVDRAAMETVEVRVLMTRHGHDDQAERDALGEAVVKELRLHYTDVRLLGAIKSFRDHPTTAILKGNG